MRTRRGKIARLPKEIREQINRRLDDGEPGTAIVNWLNGLPEIQKFITEQFAGQPIRPQNLSQWKMGGYEEWTRHQIVREHVRLVAEQTRDLDADLGDDTHFSEILAITMTAELAIHAKALNNITDPKERWQKFRQLTRELSRMRRDDQRAVRFHLRREQWEATLEPSEESPDESSPTTSPT